MVLTCTSFGRFIVKTPHHPDFPPAARKLKGAWNSLSKTWDFDPAAEPRIRDVLLAVFGSSGTPCETTVTVRLDVSAWIGPGIAVAGRVIAQRKARLSEVELGPGVTVIAGGFCKRGGSEKQPDLAPRCRTVLQISDLPSFVAEELASNGLAV